MKFGLLPILTITTLSAISARGSEHAFLLQVGEQTIVARSQETLHLTTMDDVKFLSDGDCQTKDCRLILVESDLGQTSFVEYDKPLKLKDRPEAEYKLEVCREKPLESPPCVFLSIAKPRIDYVIATIDETLQVLRPEDTVKMAKTALFKVQRVVTNIYDQDKVTVRMTDINNSVSKLIQDDGKKSLMATKFEFLLDNKAFTSIPIEVTAE